MKKNKVTKTPVFLQVEALECGAVCLCMLMAYYKTWVPIETLRIECGVSRDGSKAGNMARAAEAYGFETTLEHYTLDQFMENCKFPCMVWWEDNHYVVLNGIKKGNVYINHPAYGKTTVSLETFKQSYSGIYIHIEPGRDYKPSGQRKSSLKLFADRLRGNKVGFALMVITAFIVAVCEIVIPIFANFYTRLLNLNNDEMMIGIMFSMGFVGIYYFISGVLNVLLNMRILSRLAVYSNIRFIQHILKLPMSFFSQRMAGDLTERQTNNDDVARVLAGTFTPLVIHMGLLIFYIVIMSRYSILLTAIGFIAASINLFITFFTIEKRTDLLSVYKRDKAKIDGATAAGLEMIETIKASGAENGFFEIWSGHYASYTHSMANMGKANKRVRLIPELIKNISFALVISSGAILIIRGRLTDGAFMAFYGLLGSFFHPVEALINAGPDIQNMRSNMKRIDDVISYPIQEEHKTISAKELKDASKLSGNIKIENLTFGYINLEPPVLENLSLEIKSGSKIAIVGSSGSGKSTVSKLIAGLYKPWSGKITFDGKTFSEIPKEVFTGSVAMVDQETTIFEDTIEKNIKMWDESIDDFDMTLSSIEACVHEDFVRRKGGYRHKLTENGKNLSGGQRQRLDIARALAVDPSILILDEATSALDASTENEVAKAITNRGITCIIIAHRLSAIRDCDNIFVLNRGRIVESGTHDELMARESYYRKLVSVE